MISMKKILSRFWAVVFVIIGMILLGGCGEATADSVSPKQIKPAISLSETSVDLPKPAYQYNRNLMFSGAKFKSENNRLKRQITKFAKVRQRYYYPQIAKNARDLGGYLTTDHQVVKPDCLIRSNNLHDWHSTNTRNLNRLRIKEIIDLRDAREINKLPDPGEIHSTSNRLPVVFKRAPVYSLHGARMTRTKTDLDSEAYRYQGLFDTNPNAIRAYRKAFSIILKPHRGAILYHCIEGRDRTGLLSVLILTALGVNKREIADDYLLTDYYKHNHTYAYQLNELKDFYRVIDDKYGSVNNYLHHAVGLTHSRLIRLRHMYLIHRINHLDRSTEFKIKKSLLKSSFKLPKL